MAHYIGKRLLQLIPIVIGLSFLTFLLMYISPGDPAIKKLNAQGIPIDGEVLAETREEMGLNEPFLVRYGQWLGDLVRGDFGTSYKDGLPVLPKLLTAMGKTLIWAAATLAVALALSLPLGILSAVRQNRPIDYIVRFFSFVGNSMPSFLISVLLMYVLCIRLKLLKIVADQSFKGLLLPCLAMAIPMTGRFIRQIRAQVLEELGKGYVLGARARGVGELRVLTRNVLHNSLMGILTVVGMATGTMLGGSVIIETIFSWPGIGKLVMDSITGRDYPVIQGFVVFMASIYVIINLLTDVSYRLVDPRIRED